MESEEGLTGAGVPGLLAVQDRQMAWGQTAGQIYRGLVDRVGPQV